MTYYYTILVASAQYHGGEALTYTSNDKLVAHCLVLVPLQKQAVIGVITGEVAQPKFVTKAILEAYAVPVLPAELLRLGDWIAHYYPAPLGTLVQQILPNLLSSKLILETHGLTIESPISTEQLPPPTAEQTAMLHQMKQPNTYILHGDTGTGKTRIYIELALAAVTRGQSAIILTPEIGLTSQLAASFRAVFGTRVIVVHSQLTPKTRQQTWLRIIKSTVPLIVLGPRSALFSPLTKVGLIVVDESHEPAYKQEQTPHYHAVRVASQLARLHPGASLVLGSATPPITDYYIAEQKHKPILRMRELATNSSNGTSGLAANSQAGDRVLTEVIDLKDRRAFSRSPYLSTTLLKSIDQSLVHGEQSLLYLNRRGTARVILCTNCSWQAVCPHCDLPLTYHHDLHILQCHTCGFKQATPSSCPDCGNADVVFKVVGTKAIEQEVRRLYPSARVMRFDTDNKKAERFEQHYDAVKAGEIDILIGTQLLAKGLDLPHLSTLGVIIADTSLTFPDYSAEERTYQLLAQVIGRVGRGHRQQANPSNLTTGNPAKVQPVAPERIIVQSYAPERPVIAAALSRDWDSYYLAELKERQLFFFPPFCFLLKLTCRRASSKAAEKASEQFLYTLQSMSLPLLIEGPMPSFHSKVGDKFEWQLILKTKQRPALLKVIAVLPKSGWSYDIDPINLL